MPSRIAVLKVLTDLVETIAVEGMVNPFDCVEGFQNKSFRTITLSLTSVRDKSVNKKGGQVVWNY